MYEEKGGIRNAVNPKYASSQHFHGKGSSRLDIRTSSLRWMWNFPEHAGLRRTMWTIKLPAGWSNERAWKKKRRSQMP